MSKFNFPATTSANSFAFNANTSSFGVQPQPALPTFGAQPQPALPAFGAQPQPALPAFGAVQPLATNTVTVSQPNLSFGIGATTTATSATPAFGIVAPLQQQQQQQPQQQPQQQQQLQLQPLHQQQQTTQPSFGFGQPATSAPLFGGLGTTPAQPAFSFGPQTVTTSTPAATGFNFSAPNPTTASAGILSFGTTTTQANTLAPTLTSGFFGTKTTASVLPTLNTSSTFGSTITTSGGLFGPPVATITPTPAKIGLGGIDINATQPKTIEGRSESARVKEAQLPQEIIACVHSLQQHIDQQKCITSDIARKTKNVTDEVQSLNWSLTEISNLVENNYAAVKLLRSETVAAVRQAEMAQRTHETPAALQFENTAPQLYFMELIQKYENDLITFRNQVELTEKHMRSLANPQSFTADDLKKGLHQIHESFIALAGRLHETHQKVEEQKEQYLNLRKHLLKDTTNVFAEEEQPPTKSNVLSCGPTPFSSLTNIGMSSLNRTNVAWPSCTTQRPDTGFGLGQSTFGSVDQTSAFGNTFGTSTSLTTGGDSFNLQKPPIGTKRNKH